MTGGMICPESSIAPVMANMGYILQYNLSTYEDAPRQPPRVLDKLKAHIEANIGAAQVMLSIHTYSPISTLFKSLYPF